MADWSWPTEQAYRYGFQVLRGNKWHNVVWECDSIAIDPSGALRIVAITTGSTTADAYIYEAGTWRGPIYLDQIFDTSVWDDAVVVSTLQLTTPPVSEPPPP